MNFESAISTMNNLLAAKQPQTFNRAWVRVNAPCVYRFIQKEISIERNGIDWDRLTRALNPGFKSNGLDLFERRLNRIGIKQRSILFFNDTAANSIPLPQRIKMTNIYGTSSASLSCELFKREIFQPSWSLWDCWALRSMTGSKKNSKLFGWRGYDPLIQTRLDCCIRCYRYSGSFMRYVFKTFEYAARGLKSLIAYSLDDSTNSRRRI